MKITKVEALPIDRYLFVQIHTDEGIVGLGESGSWGHLEASEAAIKKLPRPDKLALAGSRSTAP